MDELQHVYEAKHKIISALSWLEGVNTPDFAIEYLQQVVKYLNYKINLLEDDNDGSRVTNTDSK